MNKNIGEGKTILLGMPDWFLYQEFKTRLESLGFKVIGIPFTNIFVYKNLFSRINNFLRKTFLKDKSFKSKLKFESTGKDILNTINLIRDPVDYTLLIRADYYPLTIIELIKQKSKVLVGYQWDGLDRFPHILDSIDIFDRFYVFDPSDLKKHNNLLPATNFYLTDNFCEVSQDIDVYYIGNYVKKRIGILIDLCDYLKKKNFLTKICIVTKNQGIINKYKNSNLSISGNYISYEENLFNANRSKVLIDILDEVHNGLSFRVFEALGNRKKLITNNHQVKFYDFYHPNNIFIIKDNLFEGLSEFIHSPYINLNDELIYKYSFDNWIKYVLNIEPYTPINLPENFYND